MSINNITPRCGSLYGNSRTELSLNVDLVNQYKLLDEFDIYVSIRPVFKHKKYSDFQLISNKEVQALNPNLNSYMVMVG